MTLQLQDLADGGGAAVTKVSTRPAQILLAPVKVPFTLRLLVDKVVCRRGEEHCIREQWCRWWCLPVWPTWCAATAAYL